ncbi:ROK family transcriptional regulator [Hydrogenophaga aquatica]
MNTAMLPADDTPLQVRGSNHQGMRQFNERTVLQALRLHGATPKAELSRLTQLSKQTVSIIVERLLDDGLLVKQDRIRGGIGQPSVPLALNPDGAFSVGVQVGRRSLEVLVADFVGRVRQHDTFHYDHPDPLVLLPRIGTMLDKLKQDWAAHWHRVVGLGLTAPLDMHQWADVLGPDAAPVLARWQGIDLRQRVQAMTDLPVVFARDTIAACTAELLQGHGQQCANFLYVFVGTFVGGGLVLSGHLLNGPRGNAGAIGSMPLGLAGKGVAAQLLEIASGWPLERALMQRGHDPRLVMSEGIMAAEHAQDVGTWVADASEALAMAATSATALLDLDAVIIDGTLSPGLLKKLSDATSQGLERHRLAGIQVPRIMLGRVGSHARALGGALLPLHTAFFPDKDIFLKQDLA